MSQLFTCIVPTECVDRQLRVDQSDVVLRCVNAVTAENSGNFVLLATVPVSEELLHRAIEPLLRDEVDIVVVDSPRTALSLFARKRLQGLTAVNEPLPEVIAVRREFYDSCCSVLRTAPDANEILSRADGPEQVQFVRSQDARAVGRTTTAARIISRIKHWGILLESRFPGSSPLLKFGCVGASGVLVDLSVLALGLQFGVPSGLAAILAIWTAMSWNFVLNRNFTFGGPDQRPALQQYGGFCLSCLLGASVNWSVRVALLSLGGVFEASPYLVSIAGILAGTGFNFCLCSRFVFHQTPRRRHKFSARKEESGTADERIGPETNRRDHSVNEPARQSGPRGSLLLALVVISAVFGATWAISGEPTSPPKPNVEEAELVLFAKPATSEVAIPNDDVRGRPSNNANGQRAESFREVAEVTPLPRPVTPDKKKNDDHPVILERDFSDSAVEGRLKKMAAFLADDRLQGRGVNTYGLDLAADYVGDQFKKCGLDTEHYESGPFQVFRLYSLGNEGAVQQLALLDGENDPTALTLGTDYTSIMAARAERTELPVVFAGFGITAPSISYDDYADLDAEGAAVIMLRHGPPVLLNGDEELSRHTWIRTKIRNAVEHGARAVLFCNDLSEVARVQNELKLDPEKSEPLLRAELTPDKAKDAVPSVHCRRSILKAFIAKAGFDLDEVEKGIVADSKPASRKLGELRISAVVSRARTGRKLRNVLGLLEGKGEAADETIVLGAHYDHLGRGGWGSLALGANQQIHNGADDNASGTSILIEVARQLAARKEPLKRTVLFIAFSGEELGLIGSKRYVRDPLIPINQTIAMLNLDMVGRLRKDLLTVYGTGTSPMWLPLLEKTSKPLDLQIASRPGGYGPSDHASFYEKGVPVLHFFTGFHPQYHRPTDDAEFLNIEGMRRITSLVTEMVVEISESNARPVRTRIQSGLTDLSPETLDGVLSGQPARPRPVILGVSPKVSRDGKGLVIESTAPRTPAARCGLRAGDVIVRVGTTEVTTTRQLNDLVRARKHGDTVQLQIRRNGILLELDVKL